MMTNKSSPKIYEVWKVAFFYEDQPNIFKWRPVVVVDVNEKEGTVVVAGAKVTSHAPRTEFPGEVVLSNWREAGLSKPSVVRCSKIAQFLASDFEGCFKYGKLSLIDQTTVQKALEEVGFKTS